MLSFIQEHGIDHKIVSQATKRYSTDANICGLSNEAEDLESMETGMTIVNPIMGVWPKDAPSVAEEVTLRFEKGRCVAVNGKSLKPLEVLQLANKIAGRNGIGLSHALENRILGTKSRGVYEAPGMELLGKCLAYVYQAVLDRRSMAFFNQCSRHVADQIYDGRYFDPSTRTAIQAVWTLAEPANGTLKVGLYKGHMHFLALTECPHSIYFEADSSMEASGGLNPESSQGYLEVSSVEAKSMAKAGLIQVDSVWETSQTKKSEKFTATQTAKTGCIVAPTLSPTIRPTQLLQGLKGRHLKRIDDYSAPEFAAMLEYSRRLKSLAKSDTLNEKLMSQKSVAMIFQKRSTRTRVSTETGMSLMGGHALFLSSDDIQLGKNESIQDTSCVLARFNSIILARVFGHSTIEDLCKYSKAPVVNALSDMHHPLQILADFMTLQEHFGSNLHGKKS